MVSYTNLWPPRPDERGYLLFTHFYLYPCGTAHSLKCDPMYLGTVVGNDYVSKQWKAILNNNKLSLMERVN